MKEKTYWIYPRNDSTLENLLRAFEGHGESPPELIPPRSVADLTGGFERLPVIQVPLTLAEYVDNSIRSGSPHWSVRFFIQENDGPIKEVRSLRSEAAPVKKARVFAKRAQSARRR